ncbi:putative germin-like protein 2-3 [Papaver somniferum]|uniref:putative germin-like protein 2-3 n=1 Tax=Papaver somniferum TaxID=3469 RepID=UPI000E6FDA16|nr:putative germin-like protein 2-3 [Papaver somniferum]
MRSSMSYLVVAAAFLALFSSVVYANDPSSLQDFCVAAKNPNAAVFVNGLFCKDPKLVVAEDFYLAGFNKVGIVKSAQGSLVTPANVAQIPGLNTLGISLVRIDYAPRGINPPHTHPRATEVLVVLEGSLNVGFVTKVLHKGDVFVFHIGLVHFQFNAGHIRAVAIAALSSQNPGVIIIANALFESKPSIDDDVLAKAFQVDKKVVNFIQSKF